MSKPNPNWVEAPLEEARWDIERGYYRAVETGRREDSKNFIITMSLFGEDGEKIGEEERLFPNTYIRSDHQGEEEFRQIIPPW